MFETSDILYIVLAFCALWCTAFLCWFIFQVAMVIKSINEVLAEVKFQIEKVEQALNGIKTKFDTGTGHLGSMANHFKKTVNDWKDNKMKK